MKAGCAKKIDEMQKLKMENARFNDDACGQSKSSQLQPCHRTSPDPEMELIAVNCQELGTRCPVS